MIYPDSRTATARRLLVVAFTAVAWGTLAASGEVGPVAPDTPRAAMEEFLADCRAGQYAQAASRLDLGGLPGPRREAEGPALARHLKVVLDRTLWVDLDALSDAPDGDTQDGLPAGVDRVGTIATAKGNVDVLLKRTAAADGTSGWLIGGSTVRRIPSLYEKFGYGRLGDWLPDTFFTIRFLEVALWQWIGLAVWSVGSWLAAALATRVLNHVLQPVIRRTETTLDDRIVALLAPPVRLGIALALFVVGALALRLSIPVDGFLRGLEKGFAVVIGTWILTRLVDVASEAFIDRVTRDGRTSLISSVTLGRKALKAALVVLAGVGLLQFVGFNVAGIVAGLGVGGLAVALAAQKTVENLFGGVTLAADQPVRVGDFCRWGDKVGTVEEVGLRSTRIRTLDRTVVTVPNAMLSQVEIENFASRDRIRLTAKFGVRYETSPDQLRWVLAEVRKLLAGHPMISPDPARVRFSDFGASSLDIEIFAYVRTRDFNEFLKVREDVLLRIVDIVDHAGTGFAFPSQTVYFGRDPGLNADRSRAAEATVRLWREQGALPFPDPAPETLAAVEDALDWPPVGSPAARAVGR